MMKLRMTLATLGLIITTGLVQAYPLDGAPETGIRRLEGALLATTGQARLRYPFQMRGAQLKSEYVKLRLIDYPSFELPAPDPAFTEEITRMLGPDRAAYGLAVLDLSDPTKPKYAEYRGKEKQNVGSVGKIVVALGIFQALANIYPNDIEARKRILRETIVTADNFIKTDHHNVHIYNPASGIMTYRQIQIGDRASLWEYLDWMMSPSSNAAAAMLMKEAMLMVQYGKDYPVSEAESARFFSQTSSAELGRLFVKAIHQPLTQNGLDLNYLRQGSFFSKYGKSKVPGMLSYGSARELLLYALKMEQGKLIDPFSSLAIKKLMYVTERRIRYASSSAFVEAAVFFKSGSLYKSNGTPPCEKYCGTKLNSMNSLAVVEEPAGTANLHYIASLVSNVLGKNSAVEHQRLGGHLHQLIQKWHPQTGKPDFKGKLVTQ